MRIIFIIGFFLLLGVEPLFAQGCCSGGTPLANNLGIQPLESKQLFFSLSYDHNSLSDLVSGKSKIDDDSRKRLTHSVLWRTTYGISKRFSATTLFSWVKQEAQVQTQRGEKLINAAQGLGDAVVLLQYNLLESNLLDKKNTELSFNFGVKIPTGKTSYRAEDTGILLAADLQAGTGAWDIIYGGFLRQNHIFKKNLNFSATAIFRQTTSAERFGGLQTYKFGNEFLIYAGFTDTYVLKTILFQPLLMLRYRSTVEDKADQINFPNTAGKWLYLRTGTGLAFTPSFSWSLIAELPLYRELTGIQLTTTSRFRTSLNFTIPLKKKKHERIN